MNQDINHQHQQDIEHAEEQIRKLEDRTQALADKMDQQTADNLEVIRRLRIERDTWKGIAKRDGTERKYWKSATMALLDERGYSIPDPAKMDEWTIAHEGAKQKVARAKGQAINQVPEMEAETGGPKYENVSCSQCGQDFGPGDHGFSHCADHAAPMANITTNTREGSAWDGGVGDPNGSATRVSGYDSTGSASKSNH